MSTRNAELKVGIAALVAILILAGGIVWLKELKPGRRTYLVETEFLDVGGLSRGDPVVVSGVAKGSVRSIALSNGAVKVLLAMEKDVALREDAGVAIRSAGLMGEKEVSIYPGISETSLDLSRPLRGTHEGDLVEMIGKLGDVLTSLETAASTLGSPSDTTGKAGSLRRGMGNLLSFAEEMKTLAVENRDDLRKAVTDFRASGEELRQVISANSPRIRTTLESFEISSRKLERAVVKFDSLSTELREIAEKTHEGKGTLAKLINEPTLHDDLRKTIQEANALIADIKANPSKYFRVKVF